MPRPQISSLQRAQRAEPLAAADPRWRGWYESYSAVVYQYVRFQVASPDVAEDLTAETFLKAFRSAERFDAAKGSVRVWIMAIARNTLRDYLRRARRRNLPLASLRDLASDAPSPEERLLWEEQVRRILEAVRELGQRDRDIISLRYGSGLETQVIGQILGLSETAVRTRLWRALKLLRGAIQA